MINTNTRYILIVTIIFILMGCSNSIETVESIPTLDNAQWPTPVPAAPIATSTPFPIVGLADIVTSEVTVVGAETDSEALNPTEPTATVTTVIPGQVQQAVESIQQGTFELPSLPAFTSAQVQTVALNVRQGPGPEYDHLEPLPQGDEVTVLATNRQQDWALIQREDGSLGWVYVEYISLGEALDGAPTLISARPHPDFSGDHIVPIRQIDGVSVPDGGSFLDPVPVEREGGASSVSIVSPSVDSDISPQIAGLEPITTAKIARPEVAVHPGASTAYAAIDELTDNQEKLAVLAIDPSGRWLLVDPQNSNIGWVAYDAINIEGDLSPARQIYTAWVKSNTATTRRGPAIFHETVGRLAINTLLIVEGLNEARTWALVSLINGEGQGWVRLQDLDAYGAVTDLPFAPQPDFLATQTAHPVEDHPLAPGQIVFQRASGGEIMVINSDGTGLHYLTHGIDPVLSPDGQTVAFTRWEQGEAGLGSLWLVDIDGSDERSILGFIDRQPKGPAWSPDGSHLMINYQHGGRRKEKGVCDRFKNGERPDVPMNATNPRVEVDVDGPGDVDVYLCYELPPDPHWGLRMVNVSDGSFEDMDGGTYAFRPTWDPNQSWRIVSDGGRGLLAVDINREFRQTLTEGVTDGSPVFSPDGQFIAFTTKQQSSGDNGCDIYRINGDGNGRIRLTQTPLWQSITPNGRVANNVAPEWTPDGHHIAFLTDRAGRWEIWVMNADGADQRSLFSDTVNDQLQIDYNFVDERVFSWR
ncbi:SH3 domain-containing protein [Anaerolineales bacterium HSG25]|nr:SH3 domain-containing protein [Anaerolineales bacterium HSG25]